MKYEEIYADHSYLWSIGPAYDMTGGYVDQHDLDLLLEKPSKKTAKKCLIDQIEYWFVTGIESNHDDNVILVKNIDTDHNKLREIADKYGIDY